MKVLVTGGAGLIGSHITDLAIERGLDVVVVDNLTSGKIENLNKATRFYKADICERETQELIITEKPDVVFHTAAQVSVSRSVREPAFDAAQNIVGPIELAAACIKGGVRKIIFSSSGGTVYGEIHGEPAKEDRSFNPVSPYGISKMTYEYYLDFFNREYGLKYTALRYGNVYGPRQDPHGEAGVIAIFAKALLSGRIPTINGDGHYYRDYVYVDDVAEANILCIDRGDNRAYNIGTSVATDVNEVYQMLIKCIGREALPRYGPARPGDLIRSVLDGSRAERGLGWKPQHTLEQGLRKTVSFFREQVAREGLTR